MAAVPRTALLLAGVPFNAPVRSQARGQTGCFNILVFLTAISAMPSSIVASCMGPGPRTHPAYYPAWLIL